MSTHKAAEFAEQYTRAERVRLALLILPAGAAFLLAARFWFFPWLTAFAATAGCREIGGVPGVTLLFYGSFVGLPLLVALVFGAVLGRPGYQTLRGGQYPAAGTRVFRPTRIRRGMAARLIGAAHLLLALAPLVLAAWGWSQAGAMVAAAQLKPADCARLE